MEGSRPTWDADAWKRLAAAIRTSRDEQYLTQLEVAERAGISRASLQNIESGTPRNRLPATLPKIEKALGWAPGSSADILGGASGPATIESLGEGAVIARLPEEELHQAVTNAAIAVTDNLTAREIRELSKHVMDELRQRGLLPE